mmetsp:Transcript_22598/g.54380  ORF Transcript_22598/g.54380 Transcript_22598/m.54380 type:complete len:329 (-) Transcript_22598:531-1517(-)
MGERSPCCVRRGFQVIVHHNCPRGVAESLGPPCCRLLYKAERQRITASTQGRSRAIARRLWKRWIDSNGNAVGGSTNYCDLIIAINCFKNRGCRFVLVNDFRCSNCQVYHVRSSRRQVARHRKRVVAQSKHARRMRTSGKHDFLVLLAKQRDTSCQPRGHASQDKVSLQIKYGMQRGVMRLFLRVGAVVKYDADGMPSAIDHDATPLTIDPVSEHLCGKSQLLPGLINTDSFVQWEWARNHDLSPPARLRCGGDEDLLEALGRCEVEEEEQAASDLHRKSPRSPSRASACDADHSPPRTPRHLLRIRRPARAADGPDAAGTCPHGTGA